MKYGNAFFLQKLNLAQGYKIFFNRFEFNKKMYCFFGFIAVYYSY